MAPQITISDAMFARLQAQAIPLVDSIETVMSKALEALEEKQDQERGDKPTAYNPLNAPNLQHTSITRIKLMGDELPKSVCYWNNLMFRMIRLAVESGYPKEELIKLLKVNFQQGKKNDHGYAYVEELGVSVQGQNANKAWEQTATIADELGASLEVEFRWQDNEKAHAAGRPGLFVMHLK